MMINSICFIPSLLLIYSKTYKDYFKIKKIISFFNFFVMVLQIASIICWSIEIWFKEKSIFLNMLVIISLVLVSFCWWENYVNENSEKLFLKLLAKVKKDLDKSRHKTYLIISIWNMIFILLLMLLIFYIENPANSILTNFKDTFKRHKINIIREKGISNEQLTINSNSYIPIALLLIQMFCSLMAYSIGKFVCRICMQLFSFSFPLALVAPTTISIVTIFCRLRFKDVCIISHLFGVGLPDVPVQPGLSRI